jgi:hypothetical protein
VGRPLLLAAAAGLLVSACGFLRMGMSLDCTTVDAADCRRIADRIVAEKQRQEPGRAIQSLRILDDQGSYDLVWEGGSGETLMVD